MVKERPFGLGKVALTFRLIVDGNVLKEVDEIEDLRIILTPNLDFSKHSCYIAGRATRTLGPVNRFSFDFQYIRLSEKFLSFYKEIIDAQCFLFYISLLNYAREK